MRRIIVLVILFLITIENTYAKRIFVRTYHPEWKTITLNVDEDTTIERIKEILNTDHSVKTTNGITYNTRALEDSVRIKDEGIKENDCLWVKKIPSEVIKQDAHFFPHLYKDVTPNHQILIMGAAGSKDYDASTLPVLYRINNSVEPNPDFLADITNSRHMGYLPSNHFTKVQDEFVPNDLTINATYLKTIYRVLKKGGFYETPERYNIPCQAAIYRSHGFKIQKGPCHWHLIFKPQATCYILTK